MTEIWISRDKNLSHGNPVLVRRRENLVSEKSCFSASRLRNSGAGLVPRRSETTGPSRSFIDDNPRRLCCRRVSNGLHHAVNPLPHRLVRLSHVRACFYFHITTANCMDFSVGMNRARKSVSGPKFNFHNSSLNDVAETLTELSQWDEAFWFGLVLFPSE